MVNYLIGGFNSAEKYEFISWDFYSIPNWMDKTSSKPPFSHLYNSVAR